MKKYLSFILSFLLVITTITVTPVHADGELRHEVLYMGVEYDVAAGSEKEQYEFTFTAPKDGMYVIRLTRDTGSCYLGKSYMNGEEVEPYAEDFRMADNAELFYYQLEKDEQVIISVGVSTNSLGKIMADTVEELQLGQELEFEGEFDKSYYFTMPNSFSHVKFACLNPTDSDGNRILNMRVRYFQESSLEEETYMRTPDKYINTALNPIDTKNKPHIFNIYAHKWPQTSGDEKKAKSKIKFMRMEEVNGEIELNKYTNPPTLIEGTACTEKISENGEKYNKYYYSALSYIKSYRIPFWDKTIEVPANASATNEQDPYSPYTGYYLETSDDQDYNHWTAGGDNYFTAKVQYQEFKVPVILKSRGQLDKLNLYEDSSYVVVPNQGTLRYFTFTPTETGNYSLFTYIDDDSTNCDNNLIVTVVDENDNQRPYSANPTKLNNRKIQYESKYMEFEEGKTYTIELYITHKDTNSTAGEPVNVTVAMKDPVPIQSVTINRNGVRPLLVDGIDNVRGFYEYSLDKYIDSIDVEYTDSTLCKYTYDKTKKTFVTDADRKYTVYPFVIKDYQSTTPWKVGSNSIDICIGDFTRQFAFEVGEKGTTGGEEETTPVVTTENSEEITTPDVTTENSEEVTTPDVTTENGEDVTTSDVTTKNDEEVTTPDATTENGEEVTTTDATKEPEITSVNNGSEITSSKKQQTTSKNVEKEPKATRVKKVKSAKKSLIVTWLKVKEVKGYEIQVATDKKFKKNRKTVFIKKAKIVKQKIKKLKGKKKYFVRIRAYKFNGRIKVYSGWSKVKSGKTK